MKILIACDGELPPAALAVQSKFGSGVDLVKKNEITTHKLRDYDFVIVTSVGDVSSVRTAHNNKKRGAFVVAITSEAGLAYAARANAVFRPNDSAKLLAWINAR